MDESVEFTDVEAEARAIAGMSGEADDEQAVAQVRQRLRELEELPLIDAIMNIAHHCASLPVYDDRTADEILGYDEHGLPT